MELENGEYFAITKGIKLNNKSLFGFDSLFMDNEQWKLGTKEERVEEDRYDRSYHDFIFLAEEICYPMVAAKVIVSGSSFWPVGLVMSLNLSEVEIMTLTKKYVEAVLNSQIQNKKVDM